MTIEHDSGPHHPPATDGPTATDDPTATDGPTATDAPGPCTVGIFDSGVGGLTVAAALHRLRPALPLHYVADTARFPYGDRSEAEVRARAVAVTQMLVAAGCRLVVVACNTASSAALETLRATFSIPIVGMEPPLKPAAERTRTGRIAVLATEGTVRGQRLARLHRAHARDIEVLTLPMPGLADRVEDGEIAGEALEASLRADLAPLHGSGADALALGCTHYGFLRPVLQRLLGEDVEIIDAADPVARRAEDRLLFAGETLPDGEPRPVAVSVTGDRDRFARALASLRAAGAALPPLDLLAGRGLADSEAGLLVGDVSIR